MSSEEKLKRYNPGDAVAVDIPLDGPLDERAYISAVFRGPTDDPHGGLFVVQSEGGSAGGNTARVTGVIPREARAGLYGLYRGQISWRTNAPPAWRGKELTVALAGDDVAFIVNPVDSPPQPRLPDIAPDRDD